MVDGAATGAWSQFDQTSYVIDPRCATIAPAAPAEAEAAPTPTAQKFRRSSTTSEPVGQDL